MAEQRPPIAWSGPPDPDKGIYFPIVTPKPGKDVNAFILSECIVGVIVYYVPPMNTGDRGHSLPCTCGENPCEGRINKRDHRWKGYLACWDRNKGRLFLGEVTKEAYLRCPAFELFKGGLRGKILTLRRNGEAANSRCTAEVRQYAGSPMQMPPAFNVQSALERIWYGERMYSSQPPRPRPPLEDDDDGPDGVGVPVEQV